MSDEESQNRESPRESAPAEPAAAPVESSVTPPTAPAQPTVGSFPPPPAASPPAPAAPPMAAPPVAAPTDLPPLPPTQRPSDAAIAAGTANPYGLPEIAVQRPEVAVGAAFAGGLVLAQILSRLAR